MLKLIQARNAALVFDILGSKFQKSPPSLQIIVNSAKSFSSISPLLRTKTKTLLQPATATATSQVLWRNGGVRNYGDENGEKLIGERKLWVGGGIHLNIREEGSGDHIVLCLPGILGTHETDFGKIIDGLDKTKFHVVCWDPPGYGKSRPNKRFDIGDYYKRDATLARQLMDRLGYKQFSILGWAPGGTTALNFAADYPERVTNIVIWGAHAFYNEDILKRLHDWADIKNWDKMLPLYEEEYVQQMLLRYKDSVSHYVKTGKDKRIDHCCEYTKCPSLVFHGGKDHLVDLDQAQTFVDKIKNCKLHKIPYAGHELHLTHTEEFLKEVEKFLLTQNPNPMPEPIDRFALNRA